MPWKRSNVTSAAKPASPAPSLPISGFICDTLGLGRKTYMCSAAKAIA
jgi:hypothetical protein